MAQDNEGEQHENRFEINKNSTLLDLNTEK